MQKRCFAIDRLLGEGWFDNEKEACAWIMERNVLVNEQPVCSPKEKIPVDGVIRLKKAYKRKYVNKGGLKLEKCIDAMNISLEGKVALDCGASTGGFTDCLLQHGAKTVYAVDIGFGQLAGKLQVDSRVINMEKTNLGDDLLQELNPRPEIISLDLSYLSLKKAIPICMNILGNSGTIMCLVKPLFEVESPEIRQSGIISDKETYIDILKNLCDYFKQLNLRIIGVTYSAVTGNSGTLEYFIGISYGDTDYKASDKDTEEMIKKAVDGSYSLQCFDKNQ